MTRNHLEQQPCSYDNHGKPVQQWLPGMQSSHFLHQCIERGVRVQECTAELQQRKQRVAAGMAAPGRK